MFDNLPANANPADANKAWANGRPDDYTYPPPTHRTTTVIVIDWSKAPMQSELDDIEAYLSQVIREDYGTEAYTASGYPGPYAYPKRISTITHNGDSQAG